MADNPPTDATQTVSLPEADLAGAGLARPAGGGAAWRAAYLGAAFVLYLADQATKAWAVRRLRLGPDVSVIDGFFKLAYAENPGIAFGQFQGGGSFGRWMLASLAGAAAVAVFVYFWRTPRADDRVLGA
ncbi:MAG TPA: signal peptidase II, partial [Pyrinomonadaceae bacterium]|nr:signal peptidase II [Pyrinomonadaceae bacterium]